MSRTKSLTVYDRIYKHLFDDREKSSLSEKDYEVKQRVQAVFIKKIDNPTITDKEMVNIIMNTFEVSMQTAYNDINGVEMIFGDIRRANKEYIRLMVTETQKLIINIERNRIAQNHKELQQWQNVIDTLSKGLDTTEEGEKISMPRRPDIYSTKDLTQAVSVLARANNLDKEDPNLPNWEDVQPPIIEPTDDVTIMDLEPIPDGTIKKLKEKYLGKISEIQEAEEVK